jgi:NAD(P)-dependent dehydrogenase (short-subunit alcohol dehydrogenase family)
MKIEGLVAIVTGGASGLGEATVLRFIEEGVKVVIADVQEELGKKLEEKLGKSKAIFVKTDVSSEEAVDNLVKKAVETFGGVHIVVNSAGVLHAGNILSKNCTAKDYLRLLNINVLGTFNVSKAAAKVMSEQKVLNDKGERGIIINVASVAGFEGQRGQVIYGGTKGAIIGMTVPMARDLGKFGIRVMTIAPGVFMTPMGKDLEKYAEVFKKVSPLGRLGDPPEFADQCVALCKNGFMTGTTVRLDGGMILPHL